ncbi:hypothetical protein CSIRO_2894 [Bradyrhizobiaceae bacterium SG-6C]|nr:hypothetical protein CSIRO_2894 [Bradyrhizobiaceae bacterium SG-6C]
MGDIGAAHCHVEGSRSTVSAKESRLMRGAASTTIGNIVTHDTIQDASQ